MRTHEADLRAEVERAGAKDAATAASIAADIAAQGSEAAPGPRLRALLQFAERLALDPAHFGEEHLLPLREVGFEDRAIHDAAQVVSYFSYINRVAGGLGVDLEPGME